MKADIKEFIRICDSDIQEQEVLGSVDEETAEDKEIV